ncbi:conserved leucine-rich repeat-containing protein [Coccidioides immitis RMSCC 3703]|uniref:Conserved leucine-rich repeat-containing protein n=1 Tax=Coccidioides immitis RMSCC 3703 TaxID=454286 RepID=A0A0J8U2M0_COCIT|nr:conserved leucine-rich repeat-containing protein [Coccidioides immitis RMSCC 3703]
MAAKEPWLDGLSDDWVPHSRLSTMNRSPKHSRRPNLSALPHRPVDEPNSVRSDKHHRKPSISIAPSRRKSPASLKPSSPLSSQCATAKDSLRSRSSSVKSASRSSKPTLNTLTEVASTMNVRPANTKQSGNTPEWKRRLLRGDAPEGESGDLFGPIGLQKLFTPPSGSESVTRADLSRRNERSKLSLRSRLSGNAQKYEVGTLSFKGDSQKLKLLRSWDKENASLTWMERMSEVSPADLSRLLRESQLSINEMDMAWLKQDFSRLSLDSTEDLMVETRSRSASGLEETRNEAISPIPVPTSDMLKDRNSFHVRRPNSSASDSYCELQPEYTEDYANIDDSFDITSHSLPEGLSMGTQEFASVSARRGYLDETSLHSRFLSPSLTPSQLPPYGASRFQNHLSSGDGLDSSRLAPAKLPHPFTPKKQTNKDSRPPGRNVMKPSGSPLKLFANHDTFTNNKLLRRMSQFEETFEATLEEGTSCAIESADISHNEVDIQESEKATDFEGQRALRSASRPQPEEPDYQKEAASFCSSKHVDKRVLNSPTKGSAPKRRRTLVSATQPSPAWHEPIIESAEFSSVVASPQQHDEATVAVKDSKDNRFALSHPARLNDLPRPPSKQTEARASSLTSPSKTMRSRDNSSGSKVINHGPATNPIRKGSITTQDFLDEASKIMNHIRRRGGPRNGLPDLEESVIVSEEDYGDNFSEPSTQECFSRPPSREGGGVQQPKSFNEPDPRIISHLKRYEDSDELDVFMGASVMSLRLRSRQRANRKLDAHAEESSPTNARIHESVHHLHPTHQHATEGNFSSNDLGISKEELKTVASTGSIADSSTGSARAKGIISSQMVSHLIPEKVGAMTYDRTHHIWIRGGISPEQHITSFISEDDPFRDIPDLSVDELRELMAIRSVPGHAKKPEQLRREDNAFQETDEHQKQAPQKGSRPRTQESTSSVQSKSTRSTSSEAQPDTRATSWATKDLTSSPAHQIALKLDTSQDAQEAEHDNEYPSPIPSPISGDKKQARAVTITFSSPLVSHIAYGDGDSAHDESRTRSPAGDFVETGFETKGSIERQRSSLKMPSPRSSLPAGNRSGRPVSRIDERDEDLFEELSELNQDLSVLPAREELSLVAARDPHLDTSYNFHLSPLAEFTVNQIDESFKLELSYVAERTFPRSLRQVHGTFALAAEELIKHITDVEPYEAYWEHLRRLNLRSKKLITLLGLNKYCPRLEELDASDNSIGQLSGARNNLLTSVDFKSADLFRLTNLDLSGNQISSVVSIDSLDALETLDLRYNEIQDFTVSGKLQQLHSLKLSHNHLQELNISEFPSLKLLYLDCNHLSTIDGLEICQHLDTLSVREQTAFEEEDRLYPPTVDLDLSGNVSIRKLYLSCNKLSLSLLAPASSVSSLRLLDLASCGLESLPTTFGKRFPNLSTLNLNFNAISDVGSLDGISKLSRLFMVGNRVSRLRRFCQVLRLVGGEEGSLSKVDVRGNPLTVGFYPSPVFGNGKSITAPGDGEHIGRKAQQLIKRRARESSDGDNDDGVLAPIGGHADIARVEGGEHVSLIRPEAEDVEVEIDDPYTVPLVNPAADEKYLVHLDEATRLRRRVVELMIHAATSSRLKVLDGLDLGGDASEKGIVNMKKDWVWRRLVELGVLKKRD